MRTVFNKVLGIAAVATSLCFAGAASAIPVLTQFNIAALGPLTADTGDVLTATTITNGSPDVVGAIQTDNTGLISGQTTLLSPLNLPVTLGGTFTKTFTTPLGTFVENLTITKVSVNALTDTRGIQAQGTITQTVGTGFDPTTVFYSASYTQNQGPGTQINGSFNNSTIPPSVPEPATLALIGAGLAGISFLRWRKQ